MRFLLPMALVLVSCGARQNPNPTPCMSDTECHGDRICHVGRCRFLEEVRAELEQDDAGVGADGGTMTSEDGGTTEPARRERPMFMGGPRHDGRSDFAGPAREPSSAWVYRTRARVFASPILGPDGVIYVGSLDHSFSAIGPDGTLRWRYSAG